jgi:hypothetical protein
MAIAFLSIPSNHVSAQLGCVPIVYDVPILDTIDAQFWGRSYCFNGNAGDSLSISMAASSGDLDTYLELSDSNGTVLSSNDDVDKASSNSLIEFALPTAGSYFIYAGRYDKDTGKTSGNFILSLSSSTSVSTQPGRPTTNTESTTTGGAQQGRPTANICTNVAVDMAFIGASFNAPTNQLLALIDDNASTGWASDGINAELWFDVVLNGMQTVSSIEFNGFASSGNAVNSIKEFTITQWMPATESFDTILEVTAPMQPGYQTYIFDNPVTTDALTFFLTSNHGGTVFEVADIKVCTDTVSTDNTAGRPTTSTSTTIQTQPIVPSVPCTIQAKSSQAKTTEARLGIGGGRAVAGFLETGKTYNVTGKNNDDDGSIWWSVDKYDVVSKVKGDNIKEDLLYIADVQTTTSGDCDTVGEVSDSRIIRAPRPAPQPSTGTSSGGNSSGANTSGGNTTAPPQPIPEEGSTDQFVAFYADPGYISEGQCTTLYWYVDNVKEFYFMDSNGSESGATGPEGSKEVCPQVPTGQITLLTYGLHVVSLSGEDIYQYAEVTVDANVTDVDTCTPSVPFLSDSGTIDDRTQDSYSLFVEPCNGQAIIIEAYVGKAGGDMDPYLYVTDTNGTYYGEDNDSGADFDALLNFCVFERATIKLDVSNAYTDGTGEYYIQVITEEGFCG